MVIPSYQSARTIRRCLTGVLAQELDGRFEVIVADSGDDGASEIVCREFPGVRVLKAEARMGAAPARNWGAREAHGEVLAFIDSDCVPGSGWLARLSAAIESGACDGIGGAVLPVSGSNAVAWAGYFTEFREFLPTRSAGAATYLTPNNVAYRRAIYLRAGGFPDGYFPLEDQMFYERLRAAGARVAFDPSIVVLHEHRRDVRAFLVHQAKIGEANSRLVRVLGLRGGAIASRRWLAALLLPLLATYRFARTLAACWREERYLLIRRPSIAALCWMGMFGWGVGFAGYRQSEYGDGDPGHRT